MRTIIESIKLDYSMGNYYLVVQTRELNFRYRVIVKLKITLYPCSTKKKLTLIALDNMLYQCEIHAYYQLSVGDSGVSGNHLHMKKELKEELVRAIIHTTHANMNKNNRIDLVNHLSKYF